MTEFVKVEKIVPKFPPPAFGDIAKASNDVCLAVHLELPGDAIADLGLRSLSTRTSTTLPQVGMPN